MNGLYFNIDLTGFYFKMTLGMFYILSAMFIIQTVHKLEETNALILLNCLETSDLHINTYLHSFINLSLLQQS